MQHLTEIEIFFIKFKKKGEYVCAYLLFFFNTGLLSERKFWSTSFTEVKTSKKIFGSHSLVGNSV